MHICSEVAAATIHMFGGSSGRKALFGGGSGLNTSTWSEAAIVTWSEEAAAANGQESPYM